MLKTIKGTKLKTNAVEAMGACFGIFFLGVMIYGFVLLSMIPVVVDPGHCDPELLSLFLTISITGNVLNASAFILVIVYAILALLAFVLCMESCASSCSDCNENCFR